MSFMAAAAGASAAGSIGGALISASAARDAAQKQYQAAEDAIGLQRDMFNTQQANQKPWLEAGRGALSQMQDPDFQKSFTMADFQADPGYQFRMDQGMKALQASAAARGGLLSGNMGQALTEYGQNAASQEYQNAYNRFNNDKSLRFNRLSTLAGLGQTANGQLGQAGQAYANAAGEDGMGAANAAGAAGMAGANAWGGALSSIGNNAMGAAMMSRFAPHNQTPSDYSGSGSAMSMPGGSVASPENNYGAGSFTMPALTP